MRHEANAAFADWTARSTSSTEASCTSPVCRPAAGLNTGLVRPEVPATEGAVDPVVDGRDPGAVRIRALTGRGCELSHVSLLKMYREGSAAAAAASTAIQPYGALETLDPVVAAPQRRGRDPALSRGRESRSYTRLARRLAPRQEQEVDAGLGGEQPPPTTAGALAWRRRPRARR